MGRYGGCSTKVVSLLGDDKHLMSAFGEFIYLQVKQRSKKGMLRVLKENNGNSYLKAIPHLNSHAMFMFVSVIATCSKTL